MFPPFPFCPTPARPIRRHYPDHCARRPRRPSLVRFPPISGFQRFQKRSLSSRKPRTGQWGKKRRRSEWGTEWVRGRACVCGGKVAIVHIKARLCPFLFLLSSFLLSAVMGVGATLPCCCSQVRSPPPLLHAAPRLVWRFHLSRNWQTKF